MSPSQGPRGAVAALSCQSGPKRLWHHSGPLTQPAIANALLSQSVTETSARSVLTDVYPPLFRNELRTPLVLTAPQGRHAVPALLISPLQITLNERQEDSDTQRLRAAARGSSLLGFHTASDKDRFFLSRRLINSSTGLLRYSRERGGPPAALRHCTRTLTSQP